MNITCLPAWAGVNEGNPLPVLELEEVLRWIGYKAIAASDLIYLKDLLQID